MNIKDLFENSPWNTKLQMMRIAKGWSQDEAADRCGTTKKNYWLWENGKTYPRKNSRKAIMSAFGVKSEEIFPNGKEIKSC